MTYLRVAGQWRYLSTVMDRHSRRIVDWSLWRRRNTTLTSQALRHSARNRNPGVIFHSDRGVEPAAFEYRQQLQRLGMLQSMNRSGKMNDNAHIESFFNSLNAEELYGRTFETDERLRQALMSDVTFYNQQRLHSAPSYLPPTVFEPRAGLASVCQPKWWKFPAWFHRHTPQSRLAP